VLVYALASVPQNKPLDNIAEEISGSINQMQKDAFTISRESLSDFKKIGNGMCIPVLLLWLYILYLYCVGIQLQPDNSLSAWLAFAHVLFQHQK